MHVITELINKKHKFFFLFRMAQGVVMMAYET